MRPGGVGYELGVKEEAILGRPVRVPHVSSVIPCPGQEAA